MAHISSRNMDKGAFSELIIVEPRYVVISPVRNEEKYINRTLDAIIAQTIKPSEWVLVDDGSSDKTREIITQYSVKYEMDKQINLKDKGYYFLEGGAGSFMKGCKCVSISDRDYIVKRGGDIFVGAEYLV